MNQEQLLIELEPVAAKLYERHQGVAKEWFPHEMVPYSRGKDFEPGKQWMPEDADFGSGDTEIDEAVRAALFVNLLTEDNLPYS
jgi:acyl-[acyl-carrier-protein] desaturase